MSVSIIKTKDRKPYRQQYYALEEKYFAQDSDNFAMGQYKSWSESPFFFCNLGINADDKVASYTALLFTHKDTYAELLAGKLKEHQVTPFTPGEQGQPYLYWPSLIVENRQHGPYLIKSVFREIEEVCKAWELSISHVYSIAFTKVSERLMKRYFFTQAGLYQGKYPIMISKVSENPYLRAFLPQF